MDNIEQIERRLWEAADQLRANSKLTSTEYALPILGLIFLRHAYNRYLIVEKEIKKNLPSRGGKTRPLTKEDFVQRSALYLQEEAQFKYLLELPSGEDIARRIIHAMTLIESDYTGLQDILPREYHIFDNELLSKMLRIFDDEALRNGNGDLFGRIYEYFLMKFAMAGAQDSGEFFTPISLVQTIVNVIEPDHGTVLDPACGSGGMFVQTSHFLNQIGKATQEAVTFYGQEKTALTIRLAKMNLAVHGLEGRILEGNTFYEDNHELRGKADFVMANPPFNVDKVDAEKIKADPRLPFGLPGMNKNKEVSNGNYLWISYFYSYLNETGRAGFVMSSQASSAGNKEAAVREKLIRTGHVDVMIGIRSNFFYTRSVPCELWFFDKSKPETMTDKVLMLDARNVYRKVTRKIYDFTPEQLKNLTAIIWLYRGRTDRFLGLIKAYLETLVTESMTIEDALKNFIDGHEPLLAQLKVFQKGVQDSALTESINDTSELVAQYKAHGENLVSDIKAFKAEYAEIPGTNARQHQARENFEAIRAQLKAISKQIDLLFKQTVRGVDIAEKDLDAKAHDAWDHREVNRLRKELDLLRKEAIGQLKRPGYYHRQIEWLQSRFPDARLVDVEGLVKLVDQSELEANDWSLTPGRYVGVAPPAEDEDFNFEETIRDIHLELEGLNQEAIELDRIIQSNFEEFGV
jgi:type I restriction enzyme M protein